MRRVRFEEPSKPQTSRVRRRLLRYAPMRPLEFAESTTLPEPAYTFSQPTLSMGPLPDRAEHGVSMDMSMSPCYQSEKTQTRLPHGFENLLSASIASDDNATTENKPNVPTGIESLLNNPIITDETESGVDKDVLDPCPESLSEAGTKASIQAPLAGLGQLLHSKIIYKGVSTAPRTNPLFRPTYVTSTPCDRTSKAASRSFALDQSPITGQLSEAHIVETPVKYRPVPILVRSPPRTPSSKGRNPYGDQILQAPAKQRKYRTTCSEGSEPSSPKRRRVDENNSTRPSCRRRLFASPSKPRIPLDRSKSLNLVARVLSFDSPWSKNKDEDNSQFLAEKALSLSLSEKNAGQPDAEGIPPKPFIAMSSNSTDTTPAPQSLWQDSSNKSGPLPTVPGNHPDLKSITGETLCRLLKGDYAETIKDPVLIDCRYPYEFSGGHIKGAQNMFSADVVSEKLLKHAKLSSSRKRDVSDRRQVVVFYCEFSSQRAPTMARFLRQMDRAMNVARYPYLHYPELYIVHNGYKEFYGEHQEMCTPQNYIPMRHSDYTSQLRHFRSKAKSWSGRRKTLPRT